MPRFLVEETEKGTAEIVTELSATEAVRVFAKKRMSEDGQVKVTTLDDGDERSFEVHLPSAAIREVE